MHCLTSQGNWELRIDYYFPNRTKSYLHYNKFAVGPPEDQYQWNISGFNSIGQTDPFDHYHPSGKLNRLKFTSRDHNWTVAIVVLYLANSGIATVLAYALMAPIEKTQY